jgi:hypothetical protein
MTSRLAERGSKLRSKRSSKRGSSHYSRKVRWLELQIIEAAGEMLDAYRFEIYPVGKHSPYAKLLTSVRDLRLAKHDPLERTHASAGFFVEELLQSPPKEVKLALRRALGRVLDAAMDLHDFRKLPNAVAVINAAKIFKRLLLKQPKERRAVDGWQAFKSLLEQQLSSTSATSTTSTSDDEQALRGATRSATVRTRRRSS